MIINFSQSSATEQKTAALILPVLESADLPASTLAADSNKLITNLIDQGDFKGKSGETLWLHQPADVAADRILLVGFGKADDLNDRNFRKAVAAAANAVKTSGATEATSFINEVDVAGRDHDWKTRHTAELFADSLYSYTDTKSKQPENPDTIEALTISGAASEQAAKEGLAVAKGMAVAKTLGNLPGNICTPAYLADQAEELAQRSSKVTTKILDEDEMEALGMGAFISVAKGSIEPGKLIMMEYQGGQSGDKPHMLLGKGITFDTGGISLKPGARMDEMKFDMCGAASVMGTINTIVELDLPINVLFMIAAAENMPAGHASKPGDIVTTMAGKTVEILNTDAEGRLVLCDALTYGIENYQPQSIVDVATLTGACMAALGGVCSGLMTQSETLAAEIQQAGEETYDMVWRLPLMDEYQELLDSNFADFSNLGGPLAGATTAACFLSKFTEGTEWAHVDIAGTAWKEGKAKGASGRPVSMLTQYLINKLK